MTILAPLMGLLGILIGVFIIYVYFKRKNTKLVKKAITYYDIDTKKFIQSNISNIHTLKSEGDDHPDKEGDEPQGNSVVETAPSSNIPEIEPKKKEEDKEEEKTIGELMEEWGH